MPSKLLIAAAGAAHAQANTDVFGIASVEPKIDRREVMLRLRRERDRFVGSVIESMTDFPEEHKLLGRARFTGPNSLEVRPDGRPSEAQRIRAERIIIATGSSPVVPSLLEPAGDRLLTTDSIFELDRLPQSVAVFGPGIIGLELGQALHRLGVRVRIFGRSGGVGGLRDASLKSVAQKVFESEGLALHPSANVHEVTGSADGVTVRFSADESSDERSEHFEYLLAATGRKPNVDGLNLAAADVQLDDDGQPMYCQFTQQTTQKHIFIAGDANSGAPLLHEAADTGRIAGGNAGGWPDILAGKRRASLSVVFCDPQISNVGPPPSEFCRLAPHGHAEGRVSFEDQGRARVLARNHGGAVLYGALGSGKFLGAELFCPDAEHLGHLLSWALQQEMTVSAILELPFYHPTLEEGLRTALNELNHALRLGPEIRDGHLDCGPGG
jgi:dihydrolipoamide dehydrogenase